MCARVLVNWVDGALGGFRGATLPPIDAFGSRRLPVDYIIILTELMFFSDKEAAALCTARMQECMRVFTGNKHAISLLFLKNLSRYVNMIFELSKGAQNNNINIIPKYYFIKTGTTGRTQVKRTIMSIMNIC